jgi:ABC-type Fe3+-hydroxamate transport system substrate-binding protein
MMGSAAERVSWPRSCFTNASPVAVRFWVFVHLVVCVAGVACAAGALADATRNSGQSEVKVPQIDSQRIVSLAPAATEWVAALDRSEWLVGRTEDCDFPPTLASLVPSVGRFLSPNLSAVLELRPSLVVATDAFNPSRLAEVSRAGGSVFLLNTKTIPGLEQSVLQLGELLKNQKRAQQLVDELRSALSSLGGADTHSVRAKRSMLAIIDVRSRFLASQESFVGGLFAAGGWANLAPATAAYPQVSDLWMRSQRPSDVFVFGPGTFDADPGSSAKKVEPETAAALEQLWPVRLQFAQNAPRTVLPFVGPAAVRVIHLPSDLFLRPGPRLIQASEILKKWRAHRSGVVP